MRPRKSNLDLPSCVYLKHSAYWLVKRGKWIRLTNDPSKIESELALLGDLNFLHRPPSNAIALAEFVVNLVATTRSVAAKRRGGAGLEHTLSSDDAVSMLKESNWRCAVTGVPFDLEKLGKGKQRPMAPSIDRINSELGYTRENCRVVCVTANFAMGSWGDSALYSMYLGMRKLEKQLDRMGKPPDSATIFPFKSRTYVK
jgi:hypothetical protein